MAESAFMEAGLPTLLYTHIYITLISIFTDAD